MPWRIAFARSTNSFSMLIVVLFVHPQIAVQAKPQARAERQLYAVAEMATRPYLAGAPWQP
jgi:hypothetical protein